MIDQITQQVRIGGVLEASRGPVLLAVESLDAHESHQPPNMPAPQHEMTALAQQVS